MAWIMTAWNKLIKGDRKIQNLIVILVLGIIIMLAGNSLFGEKKISPSSSLQVNSEQDENSASLFSDENEYCLQMEKRLEGMLSNMEGVGTVSVMITLINGRELVPAQENKSNESVTEEKDTQGGNRKTTQNDLDSKMAMSSLGGKQEPLILKEIQPKVKGVIIAADGADDEAVKNTVSQAVQTVLDIPAYKVQVYQKAQK